MRCVACWRVVLLHIFFSAIVVWIIGHDYRARWFVSSKRICDKKAIQRKKKTKEISKAVQEDVRTSGCHCMMSKWGSPEMLTQPPSLSARQSG